MARYGYSDCQVCGQRRNPYEFHHCPPSAEHAEKWYELHHQYISDMCQQRREFRMTIPVDDQDTDVVLSDAMIAQRDYIKHLEAEIARLKGEEK